VVVVAYDDTGVVVVDWSGRSSRERETPCEIVLPFFFLVSIVFFFLLNKKTFMGQASASAQVCWTVNLTL
jgi:hypothetical protein